MQRSGDALKSQFFTQPLLAKFVAKIINNSVGEKVTILDPCVGGGAIYQHIREPRIAADVDVQYFPEKLGKVAKRDFLKSTREELNISGGLAICMNPPFRLAKSQLSSVVDFLKQCDKILKKGEIIVTVAGQAERQEKKLIEIPPQLHLTKEYIILPKQPFDDKVKNKISKVNVCVQVWEKQDTKQERPINYKKGDSIFKSLPFEVKYDHHSWVPMEQGLGKGQGEGSKVAFYIRNGPTSMELLGEILGKDSARMNSWDMDEVGDRLGNFKFKDKKKYRNKIIVNRVDDKGNVKLNQSGKDKGKPARGGTITQGKSGTFMAITNIEEGKVQEVRKKFEKVYKDGTYKRFMEHKKSGDNPSITIIEVKRAYLGLLKPFNPPGILRLKISKDAMDYYVEGKLFPFPEDVLLSSYLKLKL